MNNLMETLLETAKSYPGNCGGTSVRLVYHPYEGGWFTEASWSDNTRIVSSGYLPVDEAIQNLIDKLAGEVQ